MLSRLLSLLAPTPQTSEAVGPPPPYLGERNLAKDKYKKPDQYLTNPDSIVIGSGIGGLGIASILAQRKKHKVLLLEANKVPGGCTHCHELGGYEWNSGIDSIGDMDPSVGRGMFRPTIDYITGGQLKWAKMPDVHEVAIFRKEDGTFDHYNWYSSPEKNIAWVKEKFGQDVRVEDYYALEEQIEFYAFAWGLTKLLPEWIPELVRERLYKTLGGAWYEYMNKVTAEVLRGELGFSEKLCNVFSYMYGNHGRTPAESPFSFHAVNLQHYRHGAYYPVGGPGMIAECVIPIVERAGGQVAVDSAVKEIIVEGNTAKGVELADGTRIHAPLVISDASAYTTLVELLPEKVSKKHGYPKKFTEIRPSVAHLYGFFGYKEHIELPKEIVWYLPSYDIETTDKRYKREQDFDSMGCYLLSPSARDPIFAERYPNKSTVIVLAEAPWAWAEKCLNDRSYKKDFDARLVKHLEKVVHQIWPQLKGKKPDFSQAGVPMGCNPWAWEGCSLGLEPSRDRFIRHTHWLRPQTKVENLWLTGQDSFSPGFAGSMLASRLTYAAIYNNWAFMLKKNIGAFP